ncbi:MAG: DUF4236 domain-containing protein [Bacteroidales bacterium]|nr:DUF4236 domain-containing protein [Candidatus Sodaliphilus aphodohippi]
MGWKYRKRIKLAPGVTINLSRSGVSTTIGPRGANINIGKNGAYLNTGIPGTGLYNRQKLSGNNNKNPIQNSSSKGTCLNIGCGGLSLFMGIVFISNFITEKDIIFIFLAVSCIALAIFFLFLKNNKSSETHEFADASHSESPNPDVSTLTNTPSACDTFCGKYDSLFEIVAKFVVEKQTASAVEIQNKFGISQERTEKILNELEENYIVGPRNEYAQRAVLVNNYSSLLIITSDMVLKWCRESKDANTNNNINQSQNPIHVSHTITEAQYDFIKKECENLYYFIIKHIKNAQFQGEVDRMFCINNNDGTPWEIDLKIQFVIFADILRCFKGLGHDFKLDDDEENIGLYMFMFKYLQPEADVSYENRKLMKPTLKESFVNVLETTDVLNQNSSQMPANEFFLQNVFDNYNQELKTQYMTLIYRFASAVANADGVINETEKQWLAEIMQSKEKITLGNNGSSNVNKSNLNKNKMPTSSPFDELTELIGLATVKEEITKLSNFIKIQKLRERKGLKTSSVSYHCVFTGNPGTGKTTVARIIASIYKELGVIKKGHLIETDRSGLVAEYVGQTAVKTNKIIDSALDGVLFIDEAYSLVKSSKEDYGQEAIATLLKRMEDNRDRLIVILAGYRNEMKGFIDSNPGLQSRFNRYVDFSDYNAEELYEIFMKNVRSHDYYMDEGAKTKLKQILYETVENKDVNFGNARFVRNIFEKTLENQAMRLATEKRISEDMLKEINPADIQR